MRFLPTNQMWRYWSLETFLADVSAEGMRDVDLWLCNCHVNIDAHGLYNAGEMIVACRKHGVRIRTLTPEQGNPKAYNVASSDAETKRLTLGYYRNVVELAALAGASRISINAGWFPLDVEPARAWDAMVAAVAAVCDLAAEEGIEVCLETLVAKPYRLVTDLASLRRALADINRSNLRATLDTGTIARNGEELPAYLAAFGSYVGYVHLTNLDPTVFAHLAWGDPSGTLDPAAIVRTLRAGGYEGDCALEATRASYFGHPREILSRANITLKGCER